jgi:hypothetical protein
LNELADTHAAVDDTAIDAAANNGVVEVNLRLSNRGFGR